MKGIKISGKKWGDPFSPLQRKLAKSCHRKTHTLSFAVGDCLIYYRYINTIWKRLVVDYHVLMRHFSALKKHMENTRGETTQEELSPSVLNGHLESMTCLRLDSETFFVFGVILMNKLAYTAQLFLSGNCPSSLRETFSKQKTFFHENKPFDIDEDYAKFVRDKTDWFDRSLKLPRDKLVTHGLTYVSAITSSSDGITLPKLGWGRDLRDVTVKLAKLKKKYEDRYSELKGTTDNIHEITGMLLNRPDILLEPEDEKTLMYCVRRAGSELPDISEIADNIIDFAAFFCSHFAKFISRS